MNVESQMREALFVALEPIRLDLVNESHLHAGHAGSPGTGASHFRLLLVSPRSTSALIAWAVMGVSKMPLR